MHETYYTLQLSDEKDLWTHSDKYGRPIKFPSLKDAVDEAELYLKTPDSSMERASIFEITKTNVVTLKK